LFFLFHPETDLTVLFSPILRKRCKDLRKLLFSQGFQHKLSCLLEWLPFSFYFFILLDHQNGNLSCLIPKNPFQAECTNFKVLHQKEASNKEISMLPKLSLSKFEDSYA